MAAVDVWVSSMASRVERMMVGDDNTCAKYCLLVGEGRRVAELRAPDADTLLTPHGPAPRALQDSESVPHLRTHTTIKSATQPPCVPLLCMCVCVCWCARKSARLFRSLSIVGDARLQRPPHCAPFYLS